MAAAHVAIEKNGMKHPGLAAVASIRHGSETAAFGAARALRLRPDANLIPALIETLECGRTQINRAAAAYALAETPDARAIAALERAVANKSDDPKVRGYAAEALAHQHRRESHTVLLNNVTDRCEEVRFWCAFALGEMAKVDTLPLLKKLASDSARGVRGAQHPRPGAIGGIEQKLGYACQFCIAS
jgi:HEAT repeat protein